jgi:hypothetical protein
MASHIRNTFVALAVCTSTMVAWQGGLAAVGLKDANVPEIAKSYFLSSDSGALPGLYSLSGSMRTLWKSKGPAERAQENRDLAAYAKKYVSTPAFEKMYTEWIRTTYHAVDHGMKIDPQADAQKAIANGGVQQMQSQMGSMIAQSMGQIPPQTLKMLFDQDLANWKDDADKAKIYAQAKQIEPLFKTNPEAWKKQYLLLKSASMGGPSTDAAMTAAKAITAKLQADANVRNEQQAYDQHKLKVELKKRLQDFATLARSMDYAAQVQTRDRFQYFVKPEYERKSSAWKMLFRLGKEPSLAAAAAAEQWLREL